MTANNSTQAVGVGAMTSQNQWLTAQSLNLILTTAIMHGERCSADPCALPASTLVA